MQNDEIKALVSLLDEPNENNFQHIQNRIFSYGTKVIPILEEVWENTFNEIVQTRIENIIHVLNFYKTKEEIEQWVNNESHNLLKGYLIVSKFHYPDLNELTINDIIDKIKKDIWLEINPGYTALEQIRILNHIIYGTHKFSAKKDDVFSFKHLLINNLLETKTGTPLSLGILYILLAQSVHLPVFGVNLPNNFIAAYTKNVISNKNISDVIFYINPFSKGIIFSSHEIKLF